MAVHVVMNNTVITYKAESGIQLENFRLKF